VDSDEDEETGDDEVPDEDPRRTRRRSGASTQRLSSVRRGTKSIGFPLPSSDDS
jgi:hypothetical protein